MRRFDLLIMAAAPRDSAQPVYGASKGLDSALMVESSSIGGSGRGTSRQDRRTTWAFSAGISGNELLSLRRHPGRAPVRRTAWPLPYRARELQPGIERHLVKLEDGNEIAARAVLLTTEPIYRRSCPSRDSRGVRGGPACFMPPGRQRASSAQPSVPRCRRGGSAAQAAVWLARGGALVRFCTAAEISGRRCRSI